ncbi:hypothetical protein [Aquamicrobium terrae]|uniref:Uncharacterized protein n=1 Tax=Aquamicrobium terrae TaxID=1324945 RepID=A0ABV2MZ57_9HYPH
MDLSCFWTAGGLALGAPILGQPFDEDPASRGPDEEHAESLTGFRDRNRIEEVADHPPAAVRE